MQEIQASERRNGGNSIDEELNTSKILAESLQIERQQIPQTNRQSPVTKPSIVAEQPAGQAAVVQHNDTGHNDNGEQGHREGPPEPVAKPLRDKTGQKSPRKPGNVAESISEGTKICTEKQESIKTTRNHDSAKANLSNNVANKEVKTKKRKTNKPANPESKRENHSDTEVETTERKQKIETGSQDKRTSYSDNTQPVKIFFKKKPTNPKIEYIELAERSTQTAQQTQSETVASREAKARDKTQQPERGPSGRSKSEHTIQRSPDSRPASRRVAKLTFAAGAGGSGVAVGPDHASVQPLVRPLTDRSAARVAPAPGRNRSPSPLQRPTATETQRRTTSPQRQQSATGQQHHQHHHQQQQQSSPGRQQQQQSSAGRQQQQQQPSSPGRQPPEKSPGAGRQQPPSAPRSGGRRTAPATPRSQRSGGRGPPAPQDGRGITTTIRPPARPGSGRRAAARRRMQRLRGKVKEPAGHLSRGNASNIITTPGDSGATGERRTAQANCAMCTGDQEPQSRTERVRRVIHRVTAVISPDSSPPASPGRSQASPRVAARRHRQLLTRIDALAAPRRRYTEQGDNQVRPSRPWRPPPPPVPGDQLYQRAMRGASCRSCNIVRTPSPISSNPL